MAKYVEKVAGRMHTDGTWTVPPMPGSARGAAWEQLKLDAPIVYLRIRPREEIEALVPPMVDVPRPNGATVEGIYHGQIRHLEASEFTSLPLVYARRVVKNHWGPSQQNLTIEIRSTPTQVPFVQAVSLLDRYNGLLEEVDMADPEVRAGEADELRARLAELEKENETTGPKPRKRK